MSQRVEFKITLRTTLPKPLDEHTEEEFEAVLENLAFDLQPPDSSDDLTIDWWNAI